MARYVIDADGFLIEEQFYDDGRESIEASKPPNIIDGEAVKWIDGGWEIVPDFTGHLVNKDGQQIFWDKPGDLPDGVEAIQITNGAVDLDALKSFKISDLNILAQAFIARAAGTDQIPDFELQTWSTQASEAKSWAIDKTADTPVLDQIAASRGIEASTLKTAALRKTLAYEQLSAHIAGQRQGYVSRINAASSLDDLEAIDFIFTLPEEG